MRVKGRDAVEPDAMPCSDVRSEFDMMYGFGAPAAVAGSDCVADPLRDCVFEERALLARLAAAACAASFGVPSGSELRFLALLVRVPLGAGVV